VTSSSGSSWPFGLAFAIKVPMFPFHTWLPMPIRRRDVGPSSWRLCSLRWEPMLCPFQYPALSAGSHEMIPRLDPGDHRHPIRGLSFAWSRGSEAADRLLLRFPLGVRDARAFHLQSPGRSRGNLEMLNHGFSRGPLPLVGMIYERRHTRNDRRLRRALEADADLGASSWS